MVVERYEVRSPNLRNGKSHDNFQNTIAKATHNFCSTTSARAVYHIKSFLFAHPGIDCTVQSSNTAIMATTQGAISKRRKFVADGVFYAELNEFFQRELAEEGYSGVEVRVTPTVTDISTP